MVIKTSGTKNGNILIDKGNGNYILIIRKNTNVWFGNEDKYEIQFHDKKEDKTSLLRDEYLDWIEENIISKTYVKNTTINGPDGNTCKITLEKSGFMNIIFD